MPFTDAAFLFYFLPLSLLVHRLTNFANRGTRYGTLSRIAFFSLTLVFYGMRQPWWLVPFFVSIGFDFLWASLLCRVKSPKGRKILVAFSVVQNLSLLSLFKYWSFFLAQFSRIFPLLAANLPALTYHGQVLSLPPGISFYTFESMSFVIDVYRREITPPKNPLDFFSFIAMFPRFIAGPIVRYKDVASQFTRYEGMRLERGLFLFSIGLFVKCALADSFAVFVPTAFGHLPAQGFLWTWLGVLAYAMQIYFDFAGYSLMAIGLGHCFGFTFPTNFNAPYLATSVQDFWRRWHISLSSWLKDYLYIPLGGNRKGESRMYANLFLTMLLGGLWHGAGFGFLLWGAWHGVALIVERRWKFANRVVTFLIVLIGWVFFRSETFAQALSVFKAMGSFWQDPIRLNSALFSTHPVASGLCLLGLWYAIWGEKILPLSELETWNDVELAPKILALALFAFSILWSLSSGAIPFLYFQF